MAGVGDRLGTLEVGRIANVIVTDGDLFETRTRVRNVFIDGQPVDVLPPPSNGGVGGRRGGGGR